MQSIRSSKIKQKNYSKMTKALYKKQLENKEPYLDKSQKRIFRKEVHVYENDQDVRKALNKKGKERNDNDGDVESGLGRISGELYKTAIECKNCKKKFSTRESFIEHKKFKNKDDVKRKYVQRWRYVEKEGIHLVCDSDQCCFHTQSKNLYDAHLLKKHGLKIKKKNLTVYQMVIPSEDIDSMLTCHKCGHVFTRKSSLDRHMKGCMGLSTIICSICGEDFRLTEDLIDHIKLRHDPPTNFQLLNEFREKEDEINKSLAGDALHFALRERRLKRQMTSFKTLSKYFTKLTNLEDVLESYEIFNDIKNQLKKEVTLNGRIKFYLFLKVILSKPNDESGQGIRVSVIRNSIDFETAVGGGENLDRTVRKCYSDLWNKAEQVKSV